MDKSPLTTAETIEQHWEYFRSKGGYRNATEPMLRHMKRAFFAGVAQTVIMTLAKSKTQQPEEIFKSIQEQLEIYWQQDEAEREKDIQDEAKKN